jgi:hypothetical protein
MITTGEDLADVARLQSFDGFHQRVPQCRTLGSRLRLGPGTSTDSVILNKHFGHWCTIGVPSFGAEFETIPIPMLEARFMGGWERGSGGGAPC